MNSVQALYQKIDDPIKAAKETGIWLARSGMLGPNATAEAGAVIALDAFARGIPITETPNRYHLVGGRMTMKAETMLADFQAIGGKHHIQSRTSEDCTIAFEIDGDTETFSTTWTEAQAEKWPYGKEDKKGNRQLKDNWATPIARADMLWARTVSRAIRKLRPGIVGGKYTPEEIADLADYAETISGGSGSGSSRGGDSIVIDAAPAPQAERPKLPAAAAPLPAEPVATDAPAAEPAVPAESPAIERIRDLFTELQIPTEQQDAIIKKRGVMSLRSFTPEQAAELLANLEDRLAKAEASKFPEGVRSSPLTSPCTQSQIDVIKKLVAEIAENDSEFPAKYKARLAAQGKHRTADLSIREADVVTESLTMTTLEQFFDRSLAELTAA